MSLPQKGDGGIYAFSQSCWGCFRFYFLDSSRLFSTQEVEQRSHLWSSICHFGCLGIGIGMIDCIATGRLIVDGRCLLSFFLFVHSPALLLVYTHSFDWTLVMKIPQSIQGRAGHTARQKCGEAKGTATKKFCGLALVLTLSVRCKISTAETRFSEFRFPFCFSI